MNKVIKIMILLLTIVLVTVLSINNIYTNTIEPDNNTVIVSVCTGNMRALETGVSVYAGYNRMPLILSDKTLPEQLKTWLPEYIEKNRITKIIVVGPVTPGQLYEFMKLNVEVKQVNGQSISQILTKIADNTDEINDDEIIITASDPLAGVLGAYTKTPVFITATNSTYSSGKYLDQNYIEYMEKHKVKHATIVGNIPETIKNQLKQYNMTMEEISGENSLEVSENINNKLKNEGYTTNTTTAYYGFYGELPTIVPTLIKNNAVMIEDSSNTGNIIPYLKNNNISTVYVTRNTESDYLMMEETDYISTDMIKDMENNNITVKYLTKQRTLDEATGLYDMKILTAEDINTPATTLPEDSSNQTLSTKPPLIAMLEYKSCEDSNKIQATITRQINNTTTVKWNTVHPYTWKQVDENSYYATSNTGYEYYWTKEANMWKVQYKYNNTNYYNTTWIENKDNTWTEIQANKNYTWKYDGTAWKCYSSDNRQVYYIHHNRLSKSV